MNTCTHKTQIASIMFVKPPSKYLLKKYGNKKAAEIVLLRSVKKKQGIDLTKPENTHG